MQSTTKGIIGMLALAVVAAACGKEATPGTSGGRTAGPNDVILRVETWGGFLPREYALRAIPEFTLTGDGRVFRLGAQIEIFPAPAMPPVNVSQLTDEAVAKIIEEAEKAGLNGPDKQYKNPLVMDAGTTTFVYVDGSGVKHTISAYALDTGGGDAPTPPGQSAEDREAVRKLAELQRKLGDMSSWLPKDSVGEEKPYRFEALRVFAKPYQKAAGELPPPDQPEKAWPLSATLAAFGAAFEAPATRCGVVDGADLEKLRTPAQESNELTPWTSDGKKYLLIFRPLLPGESGCPAGS